MEEIFESRRKLARLVRPVVIASFPCTPSQGLFDLEIRMHAGNELA